MALQPKTEPGSLPRSISELVSVLRVAYKAKDFDEVEEELINREAKLRAEVGALREKIELERFKSIEAEVTLKMREEQCEKGKRAEENYEQLLKEVKTGGLVEKNVVEELRKKIVALEREVCELKEFRKIMLDEVKSVAELRDKIRVLKEEKVGDKNALDALNMKNIELEETVKKNLTVIEELRNKNAKLTSSADLFEKEILPAKRIILTSCKDLQSPAKKQTKGNQAETKVKSAEWERKAQAWQKEKAKRVAAITTKKLEIAQSESKIKHLEAELALLKESAESTKNKLKSSEAKNEELTKKLEDTESSARHVQEEVEKLKKDVAVLKVHINSLASMYPRAYVEGFMKAVRHAVYFYPNIDVSKFDINKD